jgi:hypothetical protein
MRTIKPSTSARFGSWAVIAALISGVDQPPAARLPQLPDAPSIVTPAGPATRPAHLAALPDPKQVGGEAESIVQVANLIYAGSKSSRCFSDYFLIQAEKASSISTSRRFHSVKLDSEELFSFPLVIMTGEGSFMLPQKERDNLQKYIEGGGFLLASAGCSSQDWDRSFRDEMSRILPKAPLQQIGLDHPIFHMVYDIMNLTGAHGATRELEGITIRGHIGVVYSQDGLNDTQHSQGCCCCGGNEITNAIEINVDILAYALTH